MSDISKMTDSELRKKLNEIIKEKLYNQTIKAVEHTKTLDNNMKGRLEQLKLSLIEPLKMLKVYEETEKQADENYNKAKKDFKEIENIIAEFETRFDKKTNIEVRQHKDNVNMYPKGY